MTSHTPQLQNNNTTLRGVPPNILDRFDYLYNLYMTSTPSLNSVKNSHEEKAWIKINSSTGDMTIRTELILDIPFSTGPTMFIHGETKPIWDDKTYDFKVIECDGPGVSTFYFAVKGPTFTSNRDFLLHRKFIADYKGWDYALTYESVEREVQPHRSKHVRAEMTNSI